MLAVLLLAGFDAVVPWADLSKWIGALLLLHAGVGLLFRERVEPILDVVRPISVEGRVLREGIALLEGEEFETTKLRDLKYEIRNASGDLRKLERLLRVLDQRDKDWFFYPSRILLVGTQVSARLERWRRAHARSFRKWLQAWAEFEALNALASYAHENPDNVFPDVSTGEAHFVAEAMGHPLLPHGSCIVNDVELSPECPFYIVSGSNMSGKSTLLRAIGLNAILAFAGAPVRARALLISELSLVASMSVVDSLLNGKSKFLAEVERLRRALESAVESRPVLFLVDEIFSGTNSRDRRIAAEAVVRTLVNRGAIGALSTHDLALSEIASAAGLHGVNVHMGARDQNNPMDFDYKLKPGVTTEANALAIARMAGVPI